MLRVDWRGWGSRMTRLWRGSLRIRTVVITVALSTIAITVIGAYISMSVSSNLFEQRLNQVTSEAGRATTSAQLVFNQAQQLNEATDLGSVEDNATSAIQAVV